MKIEKIKAIPKYMVEEIKEIDKEKYPPQDGRTRYYAYLTKNDGELVKVTVAVRNRYKKWYCKPVVVHGVHSKKCFGQDIWFYKIAGYVTKWDHDDFNQTQKPMNHDNWGWADDKMFDPYAIVVNKEYIIEKFPEYRYCAVDKYPYGDVIKYLRYYEQYPQIEYLTKLGLHTLVFFKTILRQIQKNKFFAKWLIRNKDPNRYQNYYVASILEAYKKKKTINEVDCLLRAKKLLQSDKETKPIRELFKGELDRFFSYIGKQQISVSLYGDYLKACLELGLDMTIDRNRFPHNFKYWHDIRIDEYNSKKAELDEIRRKEFYEQFYNVAMKYIGLEYNKKSAYIAIIAQKPYDLIVEGEAMKHCVGRMGYDQKFVREDSLIFFIRHKGDPSTPFVTIEYSPSEKKVLQCYACNNSLPNDEVQKFIQNKWLPYANRQISKMAA